MDEAVTHYINSHQSDEAVHVDANALALNVQDDGGGRVAILHSQTYSTSMCRQVSVGEQVEGPWGEELMDPEGRLAALMAHITAQQARAPHPQQQHLKVQTVRGDVDTSIILDSSMRLFHGPPMDQNQESIIVEVPPLAPLPPLQNMKRCPETEDWFDNNKAPKTNLKDDSMVDSDGPVLELGAAASPGHNKLQSKKSLPHKKRISRKLKKNNGNMTPQQELVVISCTDVNGRISCSEHAPEEEILPDNYVQQEHIADDAHHITHEVRPIFICQLCGEFYGEEQLKFYQHLKQHYEPHIIIENPVPELAMDKMTNSCIVDNVATIPDSIVELSLENSIPKTIYQSIDKHVLYTTSDKTLTYGSNKLQYSMASMDKEPTVVAEAEKADLYDTLDKLDLFSCGKCNKSFRKQKQCEAHIKEAHSNMKQSQLQLEDMGEFSEPEDLMEGIHVAVDEPAEHYEHTLLPHLTVENGHAHQDNRHWYVRSSGGSPVGGAGGGAGSASGGAGVGAGGACPPYCGVCADAARERENDHNHLKALNPRKITMLQEEVLQRFLDTDVANDSGSFPDSMLPPHPAPLPPDTHTHAQHTIQTHHTTTTHHTTPTPLETQPPHILQAPQATQTSQPSHAPQTSHAPPTSHASQTSHVSHASQTSHIPHEHVKHPPQVVAADSNSPETREGVEVKQEPKKKQKRFECPQCGRVFQHRNSLLYHLLSHSGKQQLCRDCGKGFYTVAALKIHKRVHNGDRPYKCEVCGREFRQWSDLKYHNVSIHTDQKMFKCEFCGKEFARKYSLNVHRRIHTGERNYKCEYCNKTFRASSYRLSHMRTHTGDKPYKCTQCDKCFRVAGDLRRHMLVHDKVRNRLNEQKSKPKDQKDTKKTPEKPEEKEKVKIEIISKAGKKTGATSTSILSTILSSSAKKTPKAAKKAPSLRKGAPNVTIDQLDDTYTNNAEVFDTRPDPHYAKYKDVYNDGAYIKDELDNHFSKQIIGYKEEPSEERDLAILRPMFRNNVLCESVETDKTVYRTENTDGKMQVYTHVEKSKEFGLAPAAALADMRHLERDVRDLPDTIENGFIERLTALYNIPAV